MSKTKNSRLCPAIHRVITTQECGGNRISRYNCPANCKFNPFSPSQYDTFHMIEANAIGKATEWLLATSPNRAQTLAELDRLGSISDLDNFGYQIAGLYFERDANGRTRAERWAAAGFPTLNNDERVIQSAIMQMRIRLIEVHRILDDRRVEVADLLETTPTEFLVCDRTLAAQACRFTTLLAWFYPLPHFWRSFAVAIAVPAISSYEPLQVAEEIVRHLGGPIARDAWNEWFGHNMVKFAYALQAVALARQAQSLANMDAEFGKAVYELHAPYEACRQTLDAIVSVAPDNLSDGERSEGFAEARVWFDESVQAIVVAENARPVLGRVLLGQKHWQINAIGTERFERLKTQFEHAFGDKVRFKESSRDNLAARFASQQPEYDPALVPPNLLAEPDTLIFASNRVETKGRSPEELHSDVMANNDRQWLDQPLPALEAKTPRQAALDPVLRPRLIRVLKDRVRTCDQRNLESGRSDDINWMLKELGAHEIIFDPPPPRTKPRQTDDEFYDIEGQPHCELEPWPPLPPRPFTIQEVIQRIELIQRTFNSALEAMNAMETAGAFIIEDVHALLGNALNEAQHAFLASFLIQAWFVFVPPGCYGPNIEPQEIQRAFQQQLKSLHVASKGGNEAAAHYLMEEGPQPAVVRTLGSLALDAWMDISPDDNKEDMTPLLTLTVIKTVVELLDTACRRSW